MNFFKKIKNNDELAGLTFKDFLNGNVLSNSFVKKQYPLLLLIAFLTFFYVGNRITCERQMSKIEKLKKKHQEVKYEALGVSAELTELTRRTSILNSINSKGLDLKESSKTPIKIEE